MQAQTNPIHLFSWTEDFIPAVGNFIQENCQGPLDEALIILPHRRAARYLTNHFKESAVASSSVLLSPTMLSLEDFIRWGLRRIGHVSDDNFNGIRSLSRLDQTFALHQVVSTLPGGLSVSSDITAMDMNRFLPWGIRLAGVMEDFFRQDLTPTNLSNVGGEVADYAALLLSRLGDIYVRYEQTLAAKGWTTPGLQCRTLARQAEILAQSLQENDVFIAGFYALTGCEDTLFHRLWNSGAHVIWHSDPALCGGHKAHWGCAEHDQWSRRWKTRPICDSRAIKATIEIPSVRFIEGFDHHSQLAALQDELEIAVSKQGSAAVVLPDTGLLAPLLRHLPDKDVNISMGYPLERSALFALLDLVLEIHLQRERHGAYPWNLLTEFVRHPFPGQLGGDKGDFPLRPFLRTMDRVLRERGRDMDLDDLVSVALDRLTSTDEAVSPPVFKELLVFFLQAFFKAYEGINTLADLADALRQTTSLLLEGCAPIWKQRLIDAECLYRTLIEAVPMLGTGLGQDVPLKPDILYSLARQVMRGQSVSFEPEPLTGLQVLGLLETRLLSFDRLYILDATEDKLPGSADHDPLLPDTLRQHLCLPYSREREHVAAYNFYRLLMSCKEAVICYPKGEHKGVLDSARLRSRFVEQLLWEKEKQIGRILAPDTDPAFIRKQYTLPPLTSLPVGIVPGPNARKRIHKLVQAGVSATLLDTYMRCPKLFFQRYVLRLEALKQANPDGDKPEFGKLMHDVLRRFFTASVGVDTDLSELAVGDIIDEFLLGLEDADFFKQMAPDAQILLRLTGRERLKEFIKRQPRARIHFLEKQLNMTFPVHGAEQETQLIPIRGTIDRCDLRTMPEDGMYILDYKTGSSPKSSSDVWENEDLWAEVQRARPENASDPELLARVNKAVGSVQLPLYCLLYKANFDTPLINAGWINLAENGQETFLFSNKYEAEVREDIVDVRFPMLLEYLLRHLLNVNVFEPVQGSHCAWCDFSQSCGL